MVAETRFARNFISMSGILTEPSVLYPSKRRLRILLRNGWKRSGRFTPMSRQNLSTQRVISSPLESQEKFVLLDICYRKGKYRN
jgi:hypothetical protein